MPILAIKHLDITMRNRLLLLSLICVCTRILLAQTPTDRHFLDAIQSNHQAEALKFLKSGANINCKDQDSVSAIMWAAYSTDLAFVKELISRGADYSQKGQIRIKFGLSYGSMAQIAAAQNKLPLLRYLLEDLHIDLNETADVLASEKQRLQFSALDWALLNQTSETLPYLQSKNAKITTDSYVAVRLLLDHSKIDQALAHMTYLSENASRLGLAITDSLQAYSTMLRGSFHYKLTHTKEAIHTFKTADTLAKSADALELRLQIEKQLGEVYESCKFYDSAILIQRQYLLAIPKDSSRIQETASAFVTLKNSYTKAGLQPDFQPFANQFLAGIAAMDDVSASAFYLKTYKLLGDPEGTPFLYQILELADGPNPSMAEAIYQLQRNLKHIGSREIESLAPFLTQYRSRFPELYQNPTFRQYYISVMFQLAIHYLDNGQPNEALSFLSPLEKELHEQYILHPELSLMLRRDERTLYSILVANLDPSRLKEAISYMLINEFARDKTILPSDTKISGLYDQVESQLKKKQVLLMPIAGENEYPKLCPFYMCVISRGADPKLIYMGNFDIFSRISKSENPDRDVMMYVALWTDLKAAFPAGTNSAILVSNGIFNSYDLGGMINPATAKTVAEELNFLTINQLSDFVKDHYNQIK